MRLNVADAPLPERRHEALRAHAAVQQPLPTALSE